MSKHGINFVSGDSADSDRIPTSKHKKTKHDSVHFCGTFAIETFQEPLLHAKTPWYINQIVVGWVFRATLLKEMPGLRNLDTTLLAGKCIRRLGDIAIDENGNNIAGFFMLSDVLEALCFIVIASARKYTKNLNHVDCCDVSSVAYINSHTIPATRHMMVSYVYLLKVLAGHPTINFLRRDAVRALIDREMSLYKGIEYTHNTMQHNRSKYNEEHIITSATKCKNDIESQVETKAHDEATQTNTPVQTETPWYLNQIIVGSVFHATVLKEMPGLHNLNATILAGKSFRRLGIDGMDDNGDHIGEFFVFSDVVFALGCISNVKGAYKYAKHQKHCDSAPSLVHINAHQVPGARITMVSYTDLLTILAGHPRMSFLCQDAVIALIDRDLSHFHKLPLSVYTEREKLTMTCVDSKILHCTTLSQTEYLARKRDMSCSCGKLKIVCCIHGGSALCIVCKDVCFQSNLEFHCSKCFVKKYPADPRSRWPFAYKRVEIRVREAIDTAFDGFIHNKGLYGLSQLRIDHRLLIHNTILAVETDEFAHRSYDTKEENARYDEFLTTTSYKFVFIRFNPDTNMENHDNKTTFEYKLSVLMEIIPNQIDRIRKGHNVNRLEIIKMFY